MASIERFLEDVIQHQEDEEDDDDLERENLEMLQRNLPRCDLSALNKRYRAPSDDIDRLRLNKTVILAYTDIAAAGSRALLGIDHRIEYYSLPVDGLNSDGLRPACTRHRDPTPTQQHFQPLQVLNCKYEQYSLVIVNTVLPGWCCHHVANTILDLFHQSNSERLYIMTVLNFEMEQLYQHSIYEATLFSDPVTEYPPFPGTEYFEDSFLSTLIQMILIDQVPTSCFIVPGYKIGLGQANNWDGSKQIISLFQDTIHTLTGLKFDNTLSNSLLNRGKNEDNVDMSSSIYI